MPYLKCEACRVRVRHVQEAPGLIDACPTCGRPLESVDHLSELMGFASIERPLDGAGDGASSLNHGRLAAAVAEVIARRRAAERQARRWTP
jgi:hypothetical protein